MADLPLEMALRLQQLHGERRPADVDPQIAHEPARHRQARYRGRRKLPLLGGVAPRRDQAEIGELYHGVQVEPAEPAELGGGDPVGFAYQADVTSFQEVAHAITSRARRADRIPRASRASP